MIKLEQPHVLLGFLYAFLGTGLFSSKSIFIKLAYAQGLDTDSVLMLRMAISLPIYLLIMLYLLKKRKISKLVIKRHFPLVVFLGFIGYFLASWFDLKGLEYIPAGLERLTLFTYPIFITVFGALFFKIPLEKGAVLTLILTYIGLWIIFRQEAVFSTARATVGVMLVLLAALSYSFYVLLGRNTIRAMGSLWFTVIAMSISSIFVLSYYGIFLGWTKLTISIQAWIWVICLAVFGTVIPSFMISEAIARIGSSRTGIVGTLGPVITIILAIFILGEHFTFSHAVGTVFVIVGVTLLTLKRK